MSTRILSYNIRYGGSGREKPLAAVINACEPDLVILQEASRPDVVERLAASCGMKAWGSVYGHSLGYLSRTDIAYHTWRRVRLARRRFLEIALPGSEERIFGVHLAAIHSNLTEQRRAYEISSVLAGIEAHRNGFHLVMGDFNTLAPGEQLDTRRLPPRLRAVVWLTGRTIRWRAIRLMLSRGYADSYRIFHQDSDPGFTFPTWDPHIRLDYTFVPAAFAVRLRKCEVMRDIPAARDASDHYPLLSEIA